MKKKNGLFYISTGEFERHYIEIQENEEERIRDLSEGRQIAGDKLHRLLELTEMRKILT